MRLAGVSSNFGVTLGNSIPLSAWTSTGTELQVTVNIGQALIVIRPQEDAFWGFLYTPSYSGATQTVKVPANSVYSLFSIPSSFTNATFAVAFESLVFPEPVLVMQGVDNIQSTNPIANMSS